MIYAFEAKIEAPKGKLSREDRTEILHYVEEQRVTAADPIRAIRQLASLTQGRSLLKLDENTAEFQLPDYGCRLTVKAYEKA